MNDDREDDNAMPGFWTTLALLIVLAVIMGSIMLDERRSWVWSKIRGHRQ